MLAYEDLKDPSSYNLPIIFFLLKKWKKIFVLADFFQ